MITPRGGKSMTQSRVLSPEWPERHKASEEKWQNIVDRVKGRVPFKGLFGWGDLVVIDRCGYCEEFKDEDYVTQYCSECPLYIDKYCRGENTKNFPKTIFWQFVYKMWDRDFTDALELAEQMLQRIKQDKPAV